MGDVEEIVDEMARRLGMNADENSPIISKAQTKTYYVQPGDIMGVKARQWGVPLSKIQELNPGVDLGKVKPEQAILLPQDANVGEQPAKEVVVYLADIPQTAAVNAKIKELATKYDVPPALIFAHVYRESGYYSGNKATPMPYFEKLPTTRMEAQNPKGKGFLVNPDRTSHAGAQGLYQVMPQNMPKGADPYNPLQSLEVGFDWFMNKSGMPEARKLISKYFNKKVPSIEELLEMALYVYNAGQGTVERALKAKGVEFRTALPTETRNYAPTILSWMNQGIDRVVVARPVKAMVK